MSELSIEIVDLSDLSTAFPTTDDAAPLGAVAGWATRGRQFQGILNDTGSGQLTFQNDDTDADLVDPPNTCVNFFVDDTLSATVLLESFEKTVISQNEEAEQVTVWSGRGHAAVLDRALVYPALGVNRTPVQEDRWFDYRDPSYDDSAWIPATQVDTVGNAKDPVTGWPSGTGLVPWADDFPDDTAAMLWGSYLTPTIAPIGNVYFRSTFDCGFSGKLVGWLTADNGAEMYIDGCLVAATSPTDGFTSATRFFVDIVPGFDHVVAIVGSQIAGETIYNPAAIAAVLYIPGYPPSMVWHTVAADTVIEDYPSEVPGMTPGAAFLIALDEAQSTVANPITGAPARGAIPYVTCSFDADLDSAGQAWSAQVDISTKVGTSLLTFLKEMSGAGYVDWKMDPGTFVLDMYNFGTLTATPGVSFHSPTNTADAATGNLTEYREKGEA